VRDGLCDFATKKEDKLCALEIKAFFDNVHENNDIINSCQQGDRNAQERLYRDYFKVMMTICLRYTRNNEDAVEVLNNGFLRVFKNIRRYDSSKASLYTWIRTIVINSCLDFVKQKQKLDNVHELNEDLEVHIAPEVISKMKGEELLEEIRKLAPATQAVFNLYAIEGYNHKEIGQLLGISAGTSKWHLSVARRTLQQLISGPRARIS
jgi:RNA polymerase sigma factor (sigma-70 family)